MKPFHEAEYAYYQQCNEDDLHPFEDYATEDAQEDLTWQEWEARQEAMGLPRIVISDTPETRIPF